MQKIKVISGAIRAGLRAVVLMIVARATGYNSAEFVPAAQRGKGQCKCDSINP